MQARLKVSTYETFDPVFDGSFEAPIDTEYDLPDYSPDIQKILKCQVTPEVSSYLVSEDLLTCDGMCGVRVLYLDAKGDRVRCCEFNKEFSASVKVKSTGDKSVACLKASVEHCTCRAISARRLDLHAAVTLRALAVSQRGENLTCDIENAEIEKQVSSYPASQAVNAVSHQFTLEDTVALKNGKPPIETILRKSLSCRVSDCRLSEGSITVSGTLEVSFLYLSSLDGAGVEKMVSEVSFSQTIDCGGVSGDCVCDLKAEVGESTLQPREDDVGEYTSVGVVAKVFLTAFLYRPCEVELVDDAYSVKAPLELKFAQASLLLTDGVREETLKKKCTLTSSEDEIEKILDLWCEQDTVQSTCDKGKLTFRVRCTLCMLYQGAGGRVLYAERVTDYTAVSDLSDDEPKKSDARCHTEIWEYRIADRNTVEVSLETKVSAFLYSRRTVKFLSSAETDETAAASGSLSRLTVYYAQPGEKLWNVAKSHRAPLSQIRVQNDLYDDTVPEALPIVICSR